MDKEKIYKAAEEAAANIIFYSNAQKCYRDGFKHGADWLMQQPLSERLTDEEKRMLRCHYHTNECVIKDHKKRTGDKAVAKAVARIKLFERIFGTDLFKEK